MNPQSLLTKLINLILYSNLWIGLCAVAMVLQVQLFFRGRLSLSPEVFFILFATLFLYAIHRLVGLQKVKAFQDQGRYKVISSYQNHIVIYAGVAIVLTTYFFFRLRMQTRIALILPTLVSLAYVIPFLTGKRRLRDFSYLKIFLIAFTWPVITIGLPLLEWQFPAGKFVSLLFLEKVFFLLAITLPFDIRDVEIDRHTKVKTLATHLGKRQSKRLAEVFLAGSWLLGTISWMHGYYSPAVYCSLFISYLFTSAIIFVTDRVQHDYYFTGLLDGTMILQFGLVYIAMQ